MLGEGVRAHHYSIDIFAHPSINSVDSGGSIGTLTQMKRKKKKQKP